MLIRSFLRHHRTKFRASVTLWFPLYRPQNRKGSAVGKGWREAETNVPERNEKREGRGGKKAVGSTPRYCMRLHGCVHNRTGPRKKRHRSRVRSPPEKRTFSSPIRSFEQRRFFETPATCFHLVPPNDIRVSWPWNWPFSFSRGFEINGNAFVAKDFIFIFEFKYLWREEKDFEKHDGAVRIIFGSFNYDTKEVLFVTVASERKSPIISLVKLYTTRINVSRHFLCHWHSSNLIHIYI